MHLGYKYQRKITGRNYEVPGFLYVVTDPKKQHVYETRSAPVVMRKHREAPADVPVCLTSDSFG